MDEAIKGEAPRMKQLESEHLSLARSALLKAAPRAAQTVISGLDDDCSKEQLSAAQDILDRVGVRKDQAISQVSSNGEGIAIAYGAFRALFDAFGIKVNLPEVPSFQLPSIEGGEEPPLDAMEPVPVSFKQDVAVAIASPGRPSSSKKKKQRPLLKEEQPAQRMRSTVSKQKAKEEAEFEIEL